MKHVLIKLYYIEYNLSLYIHICIHIRIYVIKTDSIGGDIRRMLK